MIIHLINVGNSKPTTFIRSTPKGLEEALRGYSADLVLVDGVPARYFLMDEKYRNLWNTLNLIVVHKKGLVIFMETPMSNLQRHLK